jgi:peptidoglycan-associated lipoprotein
MKNIVMIIALTVALGACRSTTEKDVGAPVEDRKPEVVTTAPPAPPPAVPAPPAVTRVDAESIRGDQLNVPGSILAKRSVYYDFDSFTVKDEYKPVVSAHAKYLTDNRGRRIVVQGNTDERGSREYNLALGQKRAESVKKMMVLLGVGDNQVETVSFGEEKPKAAGSDEGSYAENRRSDIVYDSN